MTITAQDLDEELAYEYKLGNADTVEAWNNTHDEEFHITREQFDAFIATFGITRCENTLCLARLDEGEHGLCLDCKEATRYDFDSGDE